MMTRGEMLSYNLAFVRLGLGIHESRVSMYYMHFNTRDTLSLPRSASWDRV